MYMLSRTCKLVHWGAVSVRMVMAAQQEDHEKIGADARGSNDGNQDWICEFGRIVEAVNRLEDHGYAQRQWEDAVESSTENFGTLPSKAEPLSRAIVLFAIAAALSETNADDGYNVPYQVARDVEGIGYEDECVVGEADDKFRHQKAGGDEDDTIEPVLYRQPFHPVFVGVFG